MGRSIAWFVCALLGLATPAHADSARTTCATATLAAGTGKPIAKSGLALLQKHARDTVLSEWTGRYLIVMGRYFPVDAAVYDACLDTWTRVPEWTGAKTPGTTMLLTQWSGRRVIVMADGNPVVELDPSTRAWSTPGAESRKAMSSPTGWRWPTSASSSTTSFARATVTSVGGKQTELTFGSPPPPRGFHAEVTLPDKVIIWGGVDAAGSRIDGGILDVARRRWRPIATKGAPALGAVQSYAWAGGRLAVWGFGAPPPGSADAAPCTTTGAIYDPRTSRWTAIDPVSSPGIREGAIQVVDGDRVYVFGGYPKCPQGPAGGPMADGAVLDVTNGTWRSIKLPAGILRDSTYPLRPSGHALVDHRIVVRSTPTSWIYDPKTDTLTALPTATQGRWVVNGVASSLLIRWGKAKQVSPGGGCDGPRDPASGCDPMSPIIEYLDEGWLHRF